MQLKSYLKLTKPILKQATKPFSFFDRYNYNDENLPLFTVTKERGFLPRRDPMISLPPKYDIVNKLLDASTMHQKDGKKGLLWTGDFGKTVEKELPLLDVSDVKQ